MDFVVKWEFMSNKLLLCLLFLRQPFTEDSGYCPSETIGSIYFKPCIYVCKPIYFRIYLFVFRLTWISICILYLLLLCDFFICKELRFLLTGNKIIIIIIILEVIVVRIFPHSDWIRTATEYLFVFSPNMGKSDHNNSEYGQFLRSELRRFPSQDVIIFNTPSLLNPIE